MPPRIDANGLAEVLLLGPGRTPGCGVFQNVRELLPGQYAVYETQTARLTLHTYWRLEDHDHPDDFAATARRYAISSPMLSSGSSCPTCPWQRFCPAGWIPA